MTHKEEIANRIKVMQAYLDGKEVQYFWEGAWHDTALPGFNVVDDWRIKPEPFVAERWAVVYEHETTPESILLYETPDEAELNSKFATRFCKVRIEEIIE